MFHSLIIGSVFGLLVTALVAASRWKVQSARSRLSEKLASCNLSGEEIARQLLCGEGLDAVAVAEGRGESADHYDPRRRSVGLSPAVFRGRSVWAVAVAAHECGHAIQHKLGYPPFLRHVETTRKTVFLMRTSAFLVLAGLFIPAVLRIMPLVALVMVSFSFLSRLMALPVEHDASRRAVESLRRAGVVTTFEIVDIKADLRAAAWTYIATAISSAFAFLRRR
jgi:hypothetical protein